MVQNINLPNVINSSIYSNYPFLKFIPSQLYFVLFNASNKKILEIKDWFNKCNLYYQFISTLPCFISGSNKLLNAISVSNIIGIPVIYSDQWVAGDMCHFKCNRLLFGIFNKFNTLDFYNQILDCNIHLLPIYVLFGSKFLQVTGGKAIDTIVEIMVFLWPSMMFLSYNVPLLLAHTAILNVFMHNMHILMYILYHIYINTNILTCALYLQLQLYS